MSLYTVELTGNEARFLFYSIKNKKSAVADKVREKLVRASAETFLKKQQAETNGAIREEREHNGKT